MIIPSTLSEDRAAWAQGLLERQAVLLGELSEAGLRLALDIEGKAIQGGAVASPAETAMAFSRVARAVRMTALLQSRLLKDMADARSRADFEARCAALRAEDEEPDPKDDPAYGHKARVEAIVARVAKAQGEDVETIVAEAAERLDDDDIYGDVLARPVGELVCLICRDLGLSPDWTLLAQEAWAQNELRSGAKGSPLASILNHQEHQEHQEEGPSEGAAISDCAARLGDLGSLGGSILFQRLQKAVHGASP